MFVNFVQKPTRIIGMTNASSFASDVVSAASCDGMGFVEGTVGYSAPPPSGPIVEFGDDGLNWNVRQAITADGNSNPAGTAYTWKLDISGWRYVRVTLPAPGGGITATANVEISPRWMG